MSERIHGRPSSMLAYRPEGPTEVRAAGPVSGQVAVNANFPQQDQPAEENLIRYMSEARQGAEKIRSAVNRNGGVYSDVDLFNGVQFDRVGDGTGA